MKELGKRFRGLFVLLLAATFFLQGGWFMPVNAASSNDYLIILQSSITTESQINTLDKVPLSGESTGDTKCYSARAYGVYKGSDNAIAKLISEKKIGTDGGQRLDLENVAGVKKLDDISAIESNITNPNGETVYVMWNNYSSGASYIFEPSGNVDSLDPELNSKIQRYPDERDCSYSFSKADHVTKVKSADLKITGSNQYYDFSANGAWTTVPTGGVTMDLLEDTTGSKAIAHHTSNQVSYKLEFEIAKDKVVYCTADDVNVEYDGKPHTITVDVKEPSADQVTIKYGTSADKCDKTTAPAFTEPGEYTVYYEASAPDTEYATYKGSAKVVITKDDPVVTEYTITYDLDGGKLDGMTGTVTETHPAGAVITLPAPTKEGYTFDHWEGSTYYAGDKYTVTGDHTFKAVWKTGAGGNGKKGSGTKTGDENALGAWIVLLLAAMAGTTGMVYARKRKGE